MARFNQWTQLLKASATSRRHDEKSDGVKQERYLLLDTAMGSENSGDHVIMDACGCIADQIFGGALPHVATHYYSSRTSSGKKLPVLSLGILRLSVPTHVSSVRLR